ncbi:aldehyde dehydrogenase family protein [Micromonospora sp. U56]|nr:aldehyde dehydrogenase family protein [Micromonospora sp. U56]
MTGEPVQQVQPNWIAGKPVGSDDILDVVHPWDGRLAGRVGLATPQQTEEAVAAADAVCREAAALPAHVRAAALDHVQRRLTERADEIARLITAESGKPLKWARVEVTRAASVFRLASEEARRWSGELQRLDTDPGGVGRIAMIQRVPRGPVLGVAPFNFPLNLVAHKLAPAVAVGAPIVVKPAPKTPLSALLLGELFAETELPSGMVSVVVVPNERAGDLVADPRLPVVSFTGSGPVGWGIRDAVPRKHVTLELGGNAAAVVCADWASDADLDRAASRIATFANYQAGQSCISVQRVFVDRTLAGPFADRLVAAVRALRVGDPWDETTDVGPLIDVVAAERVEAWVGEAVTAGATLLTGGVRDNSAFAPTVLADVPPHVKVSKEEIFGPVLTVTTIDGVDAAFAAVNDSRYGLQAGIFTHDIRVAMRAQAELEVGGIIVGDVPSYRADQMPYGGVKESGVGREGVRSAMEDLTHERVMVLAV